MRLLRCAPVLLLFGSACLSSDSTAPVERVPIDCATLATSLAASEASLTTTSTGLKYRDVTVGAGQAITSGNSVAVHYSGCFTDGTKFDENTTGDQPLVLRVGFREVIAGFDEGMVGMRLGGRRQLVIPPELGYGATGNRGIPPNATLVFTVDLIAAQ